MEYTNYSLDTAIRIQLNKYMRAIEAQLDSDIVEKFYDLVNGLFEVRKSARDISELKGLFTRIQKQLGEERQRNMIIEHLSSADFSLIESVKHLALLLEGSMIDSIIGYQAARSSVMDKLLLEAAKLTDHKSTKYKRKRSKFDDDISEALEQ